MAERKKKAALKEAAGANSVVADTQAAGSQKQKHVADNKIEEDEDTMDTDEGGS